MALLEKQLVVKTSTIPGAGKGLFTKKFIPKGTRIVEYKGRITTWKEVKNDSANLYMYTINRNHVIDAKRTLSALARYANDAAGLMKIKGVTNNCWYVNDGLKAYIEAKKDIPAGAEIFVEYGKAYWDVYKQNRKEEREAEKNEVAGTKTQNKKIAKKRA
jgi:SET domain-containing protein